MEAEGRKHKTLDHKTIFSWLLFNNTKAEAYYNLFRASRPDRVAATRFPSSGGGSVEEFYRARDSSARERNAVNRKCRVECVICGESACFSGPNGATLWNKN